jgi:hypothetical protein
MRMTKTRALIATLLSLILVGCSLLGLAQNSQTKNRPVAEAQLPVNANKWSLDDIVAATQIVSNIAVLIALIITLRQLTSTLRLASNSAVQSNAHALNGFYMSLATSNDLAHIYREGRKDPSSLNSMEEARFFYACVAWFAHHEQSFGQVQTGLLPAEFFASWELALREDLMDEGFKSFWIREGQFFDEPFRKFIDKIIADNSVSAADVTGSPQPPGTTA